MTEGKETPLVRAVATAAGLLEGEFAREVVKPEERMRRAVIAALDDEPDLEHKKECRLTLPDWPNVGSSKLGGFDLALRQGGADKWQELAELKWCTASYDKLGEVFWDAFKLAHAVAAHALSGFLITGAPEDLWEKRTAGAQLFEDGTHDTRDLLMRYRSWWTWLLKGSAKSRPTRLPARIATNRIAEARVTLTAGNWLIRVASVHPEGEWYDLYEGWPITEWPVPDAGPGMVGGRAGAHLNFHAALVADRDLHVLHVPGPSADWFEITSFAESFDGYSEFGSVEELGTVANTARDLFHQTAMLPDLPLRALRGCLFFESRRFHHYGHAPGVDDEPYIRALVGAIQETLTRDRPDAETQSGSQRETSGSAAKAAAEIAYDNTLSIAERRRRILQIHEEQAKILGAEHLPGIVGYLEMLARIDEAQLGGESSENADPS